MNKRIKKKWLEALRSGEFEQGMGFLCTTNDVDKFCCLGVLCELHAEEKGKAWEIRDAHHLSYGHLTSDYGAREEAYAMPPLGVCRWAGLAGTEVNELAAMNDTGRTFGEIADHIEQAL